MKWPNKNDREDFEINGFINACAMVPEARQFKLISKGERPDYIVEESITGGKYGIELTSIYLDDRSVPDIHKPDLEGAVDIFFDKCQIHQYTERLIAAVMDKICKARNGYDTSRPLILSIYVNEYIAIYLKKSDLETFVSRYESVFDAMAPFTEIVFWNLGNDGVFQVKPKNITTR